MIRCKQCGEWVYRPDMKYHPWCAKNSVIEDDVCVGIPMTNEQNWAGSEPLEVYQKPDLVNLPPHYTGHPSGIEAIQVTEWFTFSLGCVIKYVWRAGVKEGTSELEDLKKARWYLEREIQRREKMLGGTM
jgi:hypothetical protein